jgi:hypothetical protein
MNKILAKYAKGITALLGAVIEAINLGVIPHQAQNYVTIVVVFLTALGVTGIPNATSPDLGTTVADHEARLSSVEAQLPTIPDMSAAVSTGVISALRALGHTSDAPPARTALKEQAVPDAPDPTTASPADILASVEPTPVSS